MIPAKKEIIPPMSAESLEKVRALESLAIQQPQVEIDTQHAFHAGAYARTIKVPAGVMITGALIKIPTVLIVSGKTTIYVGEKTIEVDGYEVFTAAAGRKQAFLAHTDTYITMVFASDATTIEEAESQFTDETELLGSRRESSTNTVTGGGSCLVGLQQPL